MINKSSVRKIFKVKQTTSEDILSSALLVVILISMIQKEKFINLELMKMFPLVTKLKIFTSI